MTLSENAIIFVERAELAGDFRLKLTFNDATQRVVDFAPFLRRSRNPLIRSISIQSNSIGSRSKTAT